MKRCKNKQINESSNLILNIDVGNFLCHVMRKQIFKWNNIKCNNSKSHTGVVDHSALQIKIKIKWLRNRNKKKGKYEKNKIIKNIGEYIHIKSIYLAVRC